jgi:hypothetical protein
MSKYNNYWICMAWYSAGDTIQATNLSKKNVPNSWINILFNRLARGNHVPILKFHRFGTLCPELSTHNNLWHDTGEWVSMISTCWLPQLQTIGKTIKKSKSLSIPRILLPHSPLQILRLHNKPCKHNKSLTSMTNSNGVHTICMQKKKKTQFDYSNWSMHKWPRSRR